MSNFIHQIAIDAFRTQHLDGTSNTMTVMFNLAGMYMFNEHSYTGKQVQDLHIAMAKANKSNK